VDARGVFFAVESGGIPRERKLALHRPAAAPALIRGMDVLTCLPPGYVAIETVVD
jgi:hypothetical protein